MKIIRLLLVGLVLESLFASVALADDEIDSRLIINMVKQGKILSLEKILRKYPELSAMRLLDLEVEQEDGVTIYELEYLERDGTVKKWVIDARTGKLLKKEQDQ